MKDRLLTPKKGMFKAGDDAILPMILKALIGNYMRQEGACSEKWGVIKESMNMYLYEEISRLPVKLRRNFEQRLLRAHRRIYNYFVKNRWTTIKALLVILSVAEQLEEEGLLYVEPLVLREYEDIRAKITFDMGLTDINGFPLAEEKKLTKKEQIKKVELLAIHSSAQKQTPKIIRLLREQGYFNQ